MREKVQAVNSPMQYLNTLTWQSLCPPLLSLLCFRQGLKGEIVLLLVQLLCMLSHCCHASQVQGSLATELWVSEDTRDGSLGPFSGSFAFAFCWMIPIVNKAFNNFVNFFWLLFPELLSIFKIRWNPKTQGINSIFFYSWLGLGVELFFTSETMTIFNVIPLCVIAIGTRKQIAVWGNIILYKIMCPVKGLSKNRQTQGSLHLMLGRLLKHC